MQFYLSLLTTLRPRNALCTTTTTTTATAAAAAAAAVANIINIAPQKGLEF